MGRLKRSRLSKLSKTYGSAIDYYMAPVSTNTHHTLTQKIDVVLERFAGLDSQRLVVVQLDFYRRETQTVLVAVG